MSQKTQSKPLLPLGADKRIMRNRPLTSTQFYKLGQTQLKQLRELRNTNLAKMVAEYQAKQGGVNTEEVKKVFAIPESSKSFDASVELPNDRVNKLDNLTK